MFNSTLVSGRPSQEMPGRIWQALLSTAALVALSTGAYASGAYTGVGGGLLNPPSSLHDLDRDTHRLSFHSEFFGGVYAGPGIDEESAVCGDCIDPAYADGAMRIFQGGITLRLPSMVRLGR